MLNKNLGTAAIFGAALFCLVGLQSVMGQNNRSGYAEIGDGKIYYEVAGKGEKTIVFVHGGLVDSRLWDEQFDEFAEKYRVVRYDLRGFGRSQPLPDEAFSPIEDLSQLLKSLKIERVTIVGLSLGGIISTDFALERAEMVERLVLVGAGLRGFESKPSEAMIKIYQEAAKATPQKAAELWTQTGFFAALKDKPKARAHILQMLADNHRMWTTAMDDKYIFPKQASIERLNKITAPTLVVVGAIDLPDLLAIGKVLDEKIPDSELVVMKNASHHPNLEKPKEFNRILRKFLKNDSGERKNQVLLKQIE